MPRVAAGIDEGYGLRLKRVRQFSRRRYDFHEEHFSGSDAEMAAVGIIMET